MQIELSKEEIADVCAKCERYIGTQGGGMDQAIAFLATKGKPPPLSTLRTSEWYAQQSEDSAATGCCLWWNIYEHDFFCCGRIKAEIYWSLLHIIFSHPGTLKALKYTKVFLDKTTTFYHYRKICFIMS